MPSKSNMFLATDRRSAGRSVGLSVSPPGRRQTTAGHCVNRTDRFTSEQKPRGFRIHPKGVTFTALANMGNVLSAAGRAASASASAAAAHCCCRAVGECAGSFRGIHVSPRVVAGRRHDRSGLTAARHAIVFNSATFTVRASAGRTTSATEINALRAKEASGESVMLRVPAVTYILVCFAVSTIKSYGGMHHLTAISQATRERASHQPTASV
jgi:hypothetical protein